MAPGTADSAAVKQQWERIKARERAGRQQHGALDDVPLALPALPRAQKLQKRAARVGFDWEHASGVLDKIEEEIGELRAAMDAGAGAAQEEEFGDLLFCVVNLGRHLRLDTESALRRANQKFERRFAHIERALAARGQALADCDSAEFERLWEAAKREERRPA